MDEPARAMQSENGILASTRRLAATAVELLRTRLELFATEVEEERIRLLQLLVWTAGSLFFIAVGIVLLAILVAAAFWESHRLIALGALAGIFLAIGSGMAAGTRRLIRNRPRILSATLGELTKDRDQLTGP